MTQPYYAAPPPQPVQQQVAAHPHPEPRSYPLMLRTWDYAPWKPVLGFFTMLLGMFVVGPFLALPFLAAGIAIQGGDFGKEFTDALTLDKVTPAAMLYLNLSLAFLILVAAFVLRVVHRMRPRWLVSVMPGWRWKFFAACMGLSVIAVVAQVVVGLFLPGEDELAGDPNKITGNLIALGLVILLTTPLQAMGEEFAFRGYAMQAFGSLSRSPVVAVVVTSLLFALAHGVQNFPLFFDRFAFGLMAGYVVVRTGGLEAGIALHVLNNLTAFGFALFLGDIGESLKLSEVSWWNLPLTITQNGVYLILVLLVAKRMGIASKSSPPAPVVPQQV